MPRNKYRSWFVGACAGSTSRASSVAVMVDEPTAGSYFGGDVAAPVFATTVQQTLRMMGVQPDMNVKPQIRTRWRSCPDDRTRNTPSEAAQWLRAEVTGALSCDSRRIRPGDGFIAWPGAATDGRRHVPSALAQGATACLVEHCGVDKFDFDTPAIASYEGLKAATGPIAAAYYEAPTSCAQPRARRDRHQW